MPQFIGSGTTEEASPSKESMLFAEVTSVHMLDAETKEPGMICVPNTAAATKKTTRSRMFAILSGVRNERIIIIVGEEGIE
jgi:hypothetical protein